MTFLKKSTLALALAATTLTGISATPAAARDHYRRGNGDDAALAIGVGIIGLAIGAAIASSGNRDRNRYDRYEDGYYRDGRYYNNGQRYRQRDYRRGDGNRRHYDRRDGYDGRYGDDNGYRGSYGY